MLLVLLLQAFKKRLNFILIPTNKKVNNPHHFLLPGVGSFRRVLPGRELDGCIVMSAFSMMDEVWNIFIKMVINYILRNLLV